MKTNLLALLIFAIASVFCSCTKESDSNSSPVGSQDNTAPLTNVQRRIIIANCSGHGGCHSSARIINTTLIGEATILLRTNIDPNRNLSVCERDKLQSWFKSEDN